MINDVIEEVYERAVRKGTFEVGDKSWSALLHSAFFFSNGRRIEVWAQSSSKTEFLLNLVPGEDDTYPTYFVHNYRNLNAAVYMAARNAERYLEDFPELEGSYEINPGYFNE